jgi:ABC-type Fe3+/spermidine/putrescine transport system ATPase subunit
MTAAPGGSSDVSFSVRPQAISLHDRMPDVHGAAWWVPGRIAERAYLGEYWEYVVCVPDSPLRLRVNTAPAESRDVGQEVWMRIDPAQVVVIPQADRISPSGHTATK